MRFHHIQHAALATLLCVGIGIPAATILSWRAADRPALEVEGSPFVVGDACSSTIIEVPIRNRSTRSLRILGAYDHCEPAGCSKTYNLPVEIPAGGSKTVLVAYTIGAKGEAPFVLTFYSDCPFQPCVNVEIVNRTCWSPPRPGRPREVRDRHSYIR